MATFLRDYTNNPSLNATPEYFITMSYRKILVRIHKLIKYIGLYHWTEGRKGSFIIIYRYSARISRYFLVGIQRYFQKRNKPR